MIEVERLRSLAVYLITRPFQTKSVSSCLNGSILLQMPTVTFKGKKFKCERGENLRKALIENGLNPHNGSSRLINCLGIGTCGTCAVKIDGKVSPMNLKEKVRLNLAPHKLEKGLRLSCQVKVNGDISVEKGEGFWGQHL